MSSRSQRLLAFVKTNASVLNLVVRTRPQLLDSSLSGLIRITQLRTHLHFNNKRKYFYSQLQQFRQRNRSRRTIELSIHREDLFQESFLQLRNRKPEEMRGRLKIHFVGEDGLDAGGLTREWYQCLAREIFNPGYALFTHTIDHSTFQPNPLSGVHGSNHLDYFKFVGRVIGKAVVDGHLMDAHFTRSFYKHLLGVPVDYTDIEAIDPEYYKQLLNILEYSLEEIMMDHLTFSAESSVFGKHTTVDLIPNGSTVAVTDANKLDYVRLMAHHRMTAAIKTQIECFLEGFYDLVPPDLISIFSATELELLICGLPEIDIEELRINTDYRQYSATDPCIEWFWDVLRSFTREEKALFLQFVTGTSKVFRCLPKSILFPTYISLISIPITLISSCLWLQVPLDGFGSLIGMGQQVQRFSIHKVQVEHKDAFASAPLPTAHTCFNQLDLPVYANQEDLRQKLLFAIKEGSGGFGLV